MNKRLKILIISRTIIPDQTPRAFRTTELAKELARQGHKVTLYAVLGKYDYSGFEKETGIIVRNIGKMMFATRDSDGKTRYNFIDKILYHTLHRLVEFPDFELMFRIPRIIKNNDSYNLLITIAYPHPIHWGAVLAKNFVQRRKFPEKWISDCGDPYFGDLMNKKKFFYFKFIEKWWCRNTDFITIPLDAGRDGYFVEFHSKIRIIPQGFNFESIIVENSFTKNEKPTFAYAGTFYLGRRDPSQFLNFLNELNQEFRFVIYTNNFSFFDHFTTSLKSKLEVKSYVPREQLIYELSKMDFLINLKNPINIQIPSKLIDYLITKRPILDISTNFTEKEKKSLLDFINGNYENKLKNYTIEDFDIKKVSKKFIDLYYENKR